MSNKEKSQVDFSDHSCLECERYCVNRRSLGNHINRTHDMSLEDYVLKHYFNGIIPKCLCGCGLDVSWHKTQYYFCDFISGHNGSGFSPTNQPAWTPEMIVRRNDAIRKAYEKDEIRVKISHSLKETFAGEEAKRNLSVAQKRIWSNPEYKGKMASVRKRVWVEQHDELCKKIFTPEFGKKISEANMRRNLKHTSKEEESFRVWLQRLMNDSSIKDRWINDPHLGSANFDAFLPTENLLIEWDGIYYHGLDRSTGFTPGQLIHIVNDFRKNEIAKNAGLALLRIRSDVDLSVINSINDLVAVGRHYQTSTGALIKDGMFSFQGDDHVIIFRESLIRTNEVDVFPGAKGREYTRDVILPALVEFIMCIVRQRGWIYPTCDQRLSDVLSKVREHAFDMDSSVISSLTLVGNSYLKSMFSSFWNVNNGPVEATMDESKLKAVLAYRLGLNESKLYDYTLDDGMKVQCHETFNVTPKEIRTGLIVQRNAVSWFKPTAAFEVYKRFLGDDPSPVIWDPSCGFGARLLGFAAAYPKGTYLGTDPAAQTFSDLCVLKDELKGCVPDLTVELACQGSETFDPGRPLDLVFTSPPYFDREKYFEEDTQCWKMFPTLDAWKKGYLLPTLKTAQRWLRDSGRLVINIDKKNEGIILAAAREVGFEHEKTLSLSIGQDHFSKKKQGANKKAEPVLVFTKAHID